MDVLVQRFPRTRRAAVLALSDHFLKSVECAPGQVASAYWPMGDEIDPRPLMEALCGRGLRLALPVIRGAGQPLDFRVGSITITARADRAVAEEVSRRAITLVKDARNQVPLKLPRDARRYSGRCFMGGPMSVNESQSASIRLIGL